MNEPTTPADNQNAPMAVASGAVLGRIEELKALIAPLQEELSKLNQVLLESKTDIALGDIITWQSGRRKGRVLDIIPWCCGEPMYRVINIRKDGSDGSICKVRPYDKPMRPNADLSGSRREKP